MTATIQKWGNSLAVRIPITLAREVHLDDNSSVDVTVENGKLVIALATSQESASERLKRLVAGITPENRHPETIYGANVGKERLDDEVQ